MMLMPMATAEFQHSLQAEVEVHVSDVSERWLFKILFGSDVYRRFSVRFRHLVIKCSERLRRCSRVAPSCAMFGGATTAGRHVVILRISFFTAEFPRTRLRIDSSATSINLPIH